MVAQSIMLNVPLPLYNLIKNRAEQSHRTVEAELLDVVATALPISDELPPELNEAITPLALLEDDALWRAARNHLAAETAEQIENLHLKQQREGLTDAEVQTLQGLMRQYERTMLTRAHAAALLKKREQGEKRYAGD